MTTVAQSGELVFEFASNGMDEINQVPSLKLLFVFFSFFFPSLSPFSFPAQVSFVVVVPQRPFTNRSVTQFQLTVLLQGLSKLLEKGE